jgi:hypothetical protein
VSFHNVVRWQHKRTLLSEGTHLSLGFAAVFILLLQILHGPLESVPRQNLNRAVRLAFFELLLSLRPRLLEILQLPALCVKPLVGSNMALAEDNPVFVAAAPGDDSGFSRMQVQRAGLPAAIPDCL